MTTTFTSKVLLAAAVTGVLAAYGCSGTEVSPNPFTHPPIGSSQGTAGSDAGTAGVGTAGSVTSIAGFPSMGAGADIAADITKVWPSDGCGKDYNGPTGNAKGSIDTMGVKAPDCNAKLENGMPRCGAWGQPSSTWLTEPLPRDYYVYLPAGYDSNQAYPIVFQGPNCGSDGTYVFPLSDGTAPNVGNTVIRIGLTPASTDVIGHGCCPFGCFDDREGDDSVDWVFYENLYDKLNQELCFDRHRVFTSGTSSGASLANELACKYAGDAIRPVRAPMPNTGGLPVLPAEVPTCTNAPMAGMWIHSIDDPNYSFEGTKVAINRVMGLNGCAATDYDSAAKESFPIGGGVAADVCKRITGCNPLYPLVVCDLLLAYRGSNDHIANPGFSVFVKMFSVCALMEQKSEGQ